MEEVVRTLKEMLCATGCLHLNADQSQKLIALLTTASTTLKYQETLIETLKRSIDYEKNYIQQAGSL